MAEYTPVSQTQPHRPTIERSSNPSPVVNVGETERWISLIGGSALALYSLRRSLGGIFLTLLGGALAYRGLTGHCNLYQAMGVSSAQEEPDDERMIITP